MGDELPHHVEQMQGAEDFDGRNKSSLLRAFWRQYQPHAVLLTLQGQRRGQSPAHRAQRAGQRKLARKLVIHQPGRVNLATGRQNAQGNRQIKTSGILG